MNETTMTPETDRSASRRAERRANAIVAQYIHELSERHGKPAGREDRRTPSGVEVASEAEVRG